jgi:hypothetical protein
MKNPTVILFLAVLVSCAGDGGSGGNETLSESEASQTYIPARVFSFMKEYHYPGDTLFIYDHLTGDISEWWDHSFSADPYKMVIEPTPGGGFYEIFDASGDGVLHATVTGAQRGKMLRMNGPLGLAGMAIDMVITYRLEPLGADSTKLLLEVNAAGEVEEGIPEVVERVWDHFLEEQFASYISNKLNL